MTIHPKLKPFIYGLGVFVVYIILVLLLRYFSNFEPVKTDFFGLFSKNDILLGFVVAMILTFSHERKKKLK